MATRSRPTLQPRCNSHAASPHRDGSVEVIVNRQTGQWRTGFDAGRNLGITRLRVASTTDPVEPFTIGVAATRPGEGVLTMAWGTFRWTAPISLR